VNDLFFARTQMGMSLGFHILFASVGVAMPLLMVLAEWHHRRSGDEVSLRLAKSWAKGSAVMFAVGAVSGTVLSFELGLLFPTFMRHAGPVIGLPFSLEGFAFFTEAIFLGVYLYGWERVPRALHMASGIIVALSGLLSAVFVTFVNAWMNAPVGFALENGAFTHIEPLTVLTNPFALHEILHTTLSAYMTTAFAVAGIHALGLLRNPASLFDRRALALSLWLGVPCALAQPFVGHYAGQRVAVFQPAKFAAMEQLEKTQSHAPMKLGPIEIPSALSFMAFNDGSAVVKGLSDFPPDERPHSFVKVSFLGMVGIGTWLACLGAWWLLQTLRRRDIVRNRKLLWSFVLSAPLSAIATELGWMVTELGRQPWVVYGVMRTKDSVTTVPKLVVPFIVFSVLYLVLGLIVLAILRRQVVLAARRS
jgi:cytochrome bd ubiquinol oxidase subunit I